MKPIYRFLFLFSLPSLVLSGQDPRSTDQPDGLRENRPNHFALTHANVVVSPGQTRDNVTIVVQGGTIQSVLADPSKIPPGAKQIDFKGKTIYPGLIDSYSPVEIPAERIEQGAGHGVRGLARIKPFNPESPALAACEDVWLKRRDEDRPTRFSRGRRRGVCSCVATSSSA